MRFSRKHGLKTRATKESGMIPFLKRLSEAVPGKPARDIPRTFKPGAPDRRVNRPRVFDPALLHYQKAYRVGEPEFADPSLAP